MKKSKIALIGLGICLFPLIIGIPIFLTADDVGVSGADAFKIASHSVGYVIPVILGIVASGILFFKAIQDDWQEDFKSVLAILAIWLMLAVPIFGKPVNIKTDPVGSSISTKDINYLKAKGYNPNIKK